MNETEGCTEEETPQRRDKPRKTGWREPRTYLEIMVVLLGLGYHFHDRQALLDQITPEIDCNYRYETATEQTQLIVENTGLVDSRNVWISETVYVVRDGHVYEGVDVPHLSHFLYDGSRESMWDLAKGDRETLDLAEHQRLAFSQLSETLGAICVSRWTLTFSKTATTKRYSLTKDFVYDPAERVFRDPATYVSGGALIDAIDKYLFEGQRQIIGIHPMTSGFAIDPPREFIVTDDYEFVPLYPGKTESLETFGRALLYSYGPMEIQSSDDPGDGSLRYSWGFEDNTWSKAILQVGPVTVYTKAITLDPTSRYLSQTDRQRSRADPGLIRKPDQIEMNRSDAESYNIMARARVKYLRQTQNAPD